MQDTSKPSWSCCVYIYSLSWKRHIEEDGAYDWRGQCNMRVDTEKTSGAQNPHGLSISTHSQRL